LRSVLLVSREWIERVPPENILRVLICLRMLMRDHVFQVQFKKYAGCVLFTQPEYKWFAKRLWHRLWHLSQLVQLSHLHVCTEIISKMKVLYACLSIAATLELILFRYRPHCFCCVNHIFLMLTTCRCIYIPRQWGLRQIKVTSFKGQVPGQTTVKLSID